MHQIENTQSQLEFETAKKIQEKVSANWMVPSIAAIENLHIKAELLLSVDGMLKEIRIIQSSGNESFDNSLIRAVRRAQPFVIPPRVANRFESFELFF